MNDQAVNRMTRTAEQIAMVARDHGLLERHRLVWPLRIVRLRPGKHGISAGAWSWALRDSDNLEICGSPDSCRSVIAAHKAGALDVTDSIPPTFYA